ncbi:MAG: hypothetical protein JNL72_07945 [Flavipsychrobacter sp.]|nr:hypothetical protein [Flavipsychrobacter sp.]
MKRKVLMITLFAVVVITPFYFWGIKLSKELRENNNIINGGRITKCTYGGRGRGGSISIDYTFTLSNQEYKGSTSINTSSLSPADCDEYFLNRYFPVVYHPQRPSNNLILIIKRDFEAFNYQFPDSLSWILNYTK